MINTYKDDLETILKTSMVCLERFFNKNIYDVNLIKIMNVAFLFTPINLAVNLKRK